MVPLRGVASLNIAAVTDCPLVLQLTVTVTPLWGMLLDQRNRKNESCKLMTEIDLSLSEICRDKRCPFPISTAPSGLKM